MNKKTLALLGIIPFHKNFFKKYNQKISTYDKLGKDGWVLSGEGYANFREYKALYYSFYKVETVEVSEEAAIPHYPVYTTLPDYWMFGKVMKRQYLFYFPENERIEERGFTFHQLPETKVVEDEFRHWQSISWEF